MGYFGEIESDGLRGEECGGGDSKVTGEGECNVE